MMLVKFINANLFWSLQQCDCYSNFRCSTVVKQCSTRKGRGKLVGQFKKEKRLKDTAE